MPPRILPTSCLSLLLIPFLTANAETTALATAQARESYSAGYQTVTDLRQRGGEPDLAALLRGVLDAMSGTPQISVDEMRALLRAPAQGQTAEGVRDELTPISKAETFLTANAKKPGVVSLPSGLQYRILQAGTGRTPRAQDRVVVHYVASRVDGTEFDNTYADDAPETYRVDEVMPGWAEALQLMQAGSEWELVVPSRLAYGKRGPLENQTLIYRLKLLSVITPNEAPPTEQAAP